MARDAGAKTPGAVWWSFWLYLLTALWPLLGVGIAWIGALEPTVGGNRQAGYETAFVASVNALIALLQIVVVLLMRRGHRWARILLVILTVVSVFGVSIGGVYVGFVGFFGIGVSIVTIIAAILMFTPAANRYFRR